MTSMHRTRTILSFISFLLLTSCAKLTPTTAPTFTPTITNTPTSTQIPSEAPTQTPYIITATPPPPTAAPPIGTFFLSLAENGYFHLFAFSPQNLPLTRLTVQAWDDINPAISPDGRWLAYASHRNGYWNIYRMDLNGGEKNQQLTDTSGYNAAPSWSPDGAFIAYENYSNGNLDIFLRSTTDLSQAPIQLTQSSAADSSPEWRPLLGRQIAFVSNRSGVSQIWLADLDVAGSFSEISNDAGMPASHPAWSPDGNHLAWSATDPVTGLTGSYIWDIRNPAIPAHFAIAGDWPVWQDNNTLITRQMDSDNTYLTGNKITGELSLPPILFYGSLDGVSYGVTTATLPGYFLKAAQITQTALYNPGASTQPTISSGRAVLTNLTGVTAPYPRLQALAVNSFLALRARVAIDTGWDALGNLDNAYVPLTTPLDPGLGEDWLYTGRAFTLNPALIQQNWMVVVREELSDHTYWHIYLRTTAQDGSQGRPLKQLPWDFSARTTSSSAYENGGALMASIPPGYWYDLSTLAAEFGWQHLPALTNWRTYYGGARFNELAFMQGLDWKSAMLELYPPEALVTPTLVIPPTRTSTRLPLWYKSPTPTRTPTNHFTSTP
jgi:TolB protein